MSDKSKDRYGFRVYRYAPESFVAWRRTKDGSSEIIKEAYHNSDLGYILITKGAKAVVDELKRRDRKAAKQRDGLTYGFYYEGSRREYAFIRGLYTFDLSLESRLRLYKEIKQQMAEIGWQYEIGATAELGENYKIVAATTNMRTIDPACPCTIRVRR